MGPHGKCMIVGDVHGQVELLARLMDNAEERVPDLSGRWIVFVGDLVDRGEDPRGAVTFILDLKKKRGKVTSIMGNHEYVLLSALGFFGEAKKAEWADTYIKEFSSGPTFRSYGVEPGKYEDLEKAIPAGHKKFLLSLPWCFESTGFLVVHAGLIPDEPFMKQMKELRKRDGVSGRSPWLHEQRLVKASPPPDCPLTVVSGHVKQPSVVKSEKRILVDTTGGRGGVLSAVLLPEKTVLSS
jgi:serine/threonine protein phosphatase 1